MPSEIQSILTLRFTKKYMLRLPTLLPEKAKIWPREIPDQELVRSIEHIIESEIFEYLTYISGLAFLHPKDVEYTVYKIECEY